MQRSFRVNRSSGFLTSPLLGRISRLVKWSAITNPRETHQTVSMIQGEFEGLGRSALSVAFLSIPVGHKLKQLIETFVKSQPPRLPLKTTTTTTSFSCNWPYIYCFKYHVSRYKCYVCSSCFKYCFTPLTKFKNEITWTDREPKFDKVSHLTRFPQMNVEKF